jgi:hypothetical protein
MSGGPVKPDWADEGAEMYGIAIALPGGRLNRTGINI